MSAYNGRYHRMKKTCRRWKELRQGSVSHKVQVQKRQTNAILNKVQNECYMPPLDGFTPSNAPDKIVEQYGPLRKLIIDEWFGALKDCGAETTPIVLSNQICFRATHTIGKSQQCCECEKMIYMCLFSIQISPSWWFSFHYTLKPRMYNRILLFKYWRGGGQTSRSLHLWKAGFGVYLSSLRVTKKFISPWRVDDHFGGPGQWNFVLSGE